MSYHRSSGKLCCWRLITIDPLESQYPTRAVHDVTDHGCRTHQPLAFRDEVVPALVDELEIGGAGPEAGAVLVRFTDPVMDRLAVARLDEELVGHALDQQAAGRCRTQAGDPGTHPCPDPR